MLFVMVKIEHLIRSFEEAPVVDRGKYHYFVHPLTDAIPPLQPGLIKEVCEALLEVTDFSKADVIVTIEAMGIHVGAILSQVTGLPLSIIRKRQYWLPDEVVLDQSTGYSKGKLYINGLNEGMKVVLVDAVISTGGTYSSVIKGLERLGVEVVDIVAVVERGEGVAEVKRETGLDVKTLIKIEVENGKVRILDSV